MKVNKKKILVAKICCKNESSICEIAKKEEEICVSFALTPQLAKVIATVYEKYLVKIEKALSFGVEDMNRKQHSALSSVSGIHWVSWNVSPTDEGILYVQMVLCIST